MNTPQHPSPERPLLGATLRMDKLPATGRTLKIDASEAECAAMAERLHVEAVSSFAAQLHARPLKGGAQITGTLAADVVQLCVVTFVPVSEAVEQAFERVFLPADKHNTPPKPGAEVFVDLEGDDLPDYFEGPEVDLTELLMEVLALSINPYPRAPGAEVPDTAKTGDAEALSPFAALKQLKDGRD